MSRLNTADSLIITTSLYRNNGLLVVSCQFSVKEPFNQIIVGLRIDETRHSGTGNLSPTRRTISEITEMSF